MSESSIKKSITFDRGHPETHTNLMLVGDLQGVGLPEHSFGQGPEEISSTADENLSSLQRTATIGEETSFSRSTSGMLSQIELKLLKNLYSREQERRSAYQAGGIRISIGGREYLDCWLDEGSLITFKVPAVSEYLEVFGKETDGELLLGVFPLPTVEWSQLHGLQQLATYQIARIIELSISAVTHGSNAAEYKIVLKYTGGHAPEIQSVNTVSDESNLLQSLLSLVRKRVNAKTYEAWFSCISHLSLDKTTIYLTAPDQLVRDWVRSNYQDVIIGALRELQLDNFRVQIIVNGDPPRASAAFEEPDYGNSDTKVLHDNAGVPVKDSVSSLSSKYRYESFVVGSCNQFAHAASMAVAEAPGRVYNPFYIYGGVGLGKTHLMHACGHAIKARNQHLKLCYISSERFMNDLINAIRYDKTQSFREKYRSVDVLLIDDVQFMAGKERTQEEFFHTFNALYDQQKQIVISSDCPPREIPTLEERLHSRFEWGLIADLEPPDLETKIAILKRKGDLIGVAIPDDVAMFIAGRVKSNVRELEGSLVRLIAISSLRGEPISKSLAQDAIRDIAKEEESAAVTIQQIQKLVASTYKLTREELISKNNARHISHPRQVAMYLCKHLTKNSYPEIGRAFERHHSSVIHAVERIEDIVMHDKGLQELISELSESLQK